LITEQSLAAADCCR